MRAILITICALMMASINTIHAKEKKSLSEENITAFISEMREIMKPDSLYSEEEITDYLEKHHSDQIRYKLNVSYNVPENNPASQELELDKQGIIETTIQGRSKVKNYSSTFDIKGFSVENNGRKAWADIDIVEKAKMLVQENVYADFEGKSNCLQHMEIANNEHIIITEIECNTHIRFLSN